LSGRFGLREARDTLHVEGRFPAETLAALERRGHVVNRWGVWNEMAGHAHGITIDPQSDLLSGGRIHAVTGRRSAIRTRSGGGSKRRLAAHALVAVALQQRQSLWAAAGQVGQIVTVAHQMSAADGYPVLYSTFVGLAALRHKARET
jgi:hypothetical protein